MKRLWTKLAILVGGALAGAIALEGLHRGWLLVAGRPYSAAETEAVAREIATPSWDTPLEDRGPVRAKKQSVVLHPYFGFDVDWGQSRIEADLAEKNGSSPERYDIVVVGGSVAAGFALLGGPIGKMFARDPRFADKKIHLLAHAKGGFKQPQQVMVLSYLLSLGFAPDAVINIDGLNEVATSNVNLSRGVHPIYPFAGRWLPLATRAPGGTEQLTEVSRLARLHGEMIEAAESLLASGLSNSSVLGTWSLANLRERQRQFGAANDAFMERLASGRRNPEVFGPAFEGDEEAAVNCGVRAWLEGSRMLAALCKSRSIFYCHVLQPTMRDVGSKQLTPAERSRGKATGRWSRAVRIGYPLLREAGATLRGEGVAFLDCSMLFRDERETLYVDSSHFNRTGRLKFAAAIVEGFLAHLE